MAQLDEARTVADTPAAHVSDHNALHRKANYVFDVMDYGAVGDGTTDDTAAFAAAATAASTAGGGIVMIPAGVFMVDTVQPPNGKVAYQGYGSNLTVLSHRIATGPILDLSLWTSVNEWRSNLSMGGFEIRGQGTAATEIGLYAVRADGEAYTTMRIQDVSIRNTGGECFSGELMFMCVIRDCMFTRPAGIDQGHNVPYVELKVGNGTRMLNCGFVSRSANADAAAGMLRLTNSVSFTGHDIMIRDCWTENNHIPAVAIYCENNYVTFDGWSFFDMTVTNTAAVWVHLAGDGNRWLTEIPPTDQNSGSVYPAAGIKVSGDRNRIDGTKGYTGNGTGAPNVLLDSGVVYNAIIAAGQVSGTPGTSAAMVDDNSGNTTNVLLNMTNGAATLAALDGGL